MTERDGSAAKAALRISVLIMAVVVGGAANAENALYVQLVQIMDERSRLWVTPRERGGTRERNISAQVCPLVSVEKLEQMRIDVDSRAIPWIKYDVIANGPDPRPDGTQRWTLQRPVGPLSHEYLTVTIQPDGACETRFEWNF